MTDRYETTWDEPDAAGVPGTDEPPPRPNFFSRLWMVFAKPGELFEALAPNPAWFPMAAFGAAVVGISLFLTPAEAFYEAAVANTPPDQQAGLRDLPLGFFRWMAVGFATPFVLVMPVILSVMSYVIFVFIRGDKSTFKQHLCVMAHANVLSALGALVTLPLRIISGNAEERLSLADLAPFLEGFWYNVLNGMDLFAIWGCVVAGLGLSMLDPQGRWGPRAAVLVCILVIFSMIGPMLQAMFTP